MHAIASPQAACWICGASAGLYGVVDFHKSCIEVMRKRLPLSGIPIYYHRCPQCGFLFADGFRAWSPDDFRQRIYNADYATVDPDVVEVRPSRDARAMDQVFRNHKAVIRALDYGGGNGRFVEVLRGLGYQAWGYDPLTGAGERPAVRANLVTAFEVLEHVHRPYEALDDLLSFLDEDGVVLFTTLLQPEDFDRIGLGWWYVGPRNGHIGIHSRRSLALMFRARGFNLATQSEGVHLAFRRLPAFAAHLVRPAAAAPAPR